MTLRSLYSDFINYFKRKTRETELENVERELHGYYPKKPTYAHGLRLICWKDPRHKKISKHMFDYRFEQTKEDRIKWIREHWIVSDKD